MEEVDSLQMYTIMMNPVCVYCEKDIEEIIGFDGVVLKCGCRERFLLPRQFAKYEEMGDALDRSVFVGIVGVQSSKDVVKDFREKYLSHIKMSEMDRDDIVKEIHRVVEVVKRENRGEA